MIIVENETQAEFLNELLTRAYDAEQGFLVASEEVQNPALAEWFKSNSEQRRTFGHNLKRLLRSLGAEPDKGASMTGKLHQAFMKIRSAVTDSQDRALIEECHRGEEATLESYRTALAEKTFQADIAKVILDQKENVELQIVALKSIERSINS